MAHLNRSHSPSPVDINDDATINFRQNTGEVSYTSGADAIFTEPNDNVTLSPKTIREEKLLAVSCLFQLCYRTVIPNRPPVVASSTNLLPHGLGSFNPRPIGKLLFIRYSNHLAIANIQVEKLLARSTTLSVNGALNHDEPLPADDNSILLIKPSR